MALSASSGVVIPQIFGAAGVMSKKGITKQNNQEIAKPIRLPSLFRNNSTLHLLHLGMMGDRIEVAIAGAEEAA